MVGRGSQTFLVSPAAHRRVEEGNCMIAFLVITAIIILVMEGGSEAPQKQEGQDGQGK